MMERMQDAQKALLKNRPELAEAMGKTNLLGASAGPKRRKTKEEKAYCENIETIKFMKEDSKKYETPDGFAKYGKM